MPHAHNNVPCCAHGISSACCYTTPLYFNHSDRVTEWVQLQEQCGKKETVEVAPTHMQLCSRHVVSVLAQHIIAQRIAITYVSLHGSNLNHFSRFLTGITAVWSTTSFVSRAVSSSPRRPQSICALSVIQGELGHCTTMTTGRVSANAEMHKHRHFLSNLHRPANTRRSVGNKLKQ